MRWLSLVMLAGLASAAAARDAPSPRAVVEGTAGAIERNYFDHARAATIAADLRAEARAGRYDGLAPDALATALTRRLSPLDHHFRVAYSPGAEAPAPDAGPPPEPAYGHEEQDRRGGYGFRRVAVLPGNIGYLRLDSFAPIDFDQRDWPAWRAADAALTLLSRTDAIIIDLRGNGGGDPSMVGYLVSAFVAPDANVYNEFRFGQGRMSERPQIPSTAGLAAPVYILVSGRTGSGAESFAYTMQAAHRATIIGETSVGAANPGRDVPIAPGYAVFVSAATPINPITGGNWEGTGVRPDIAVPAADALESARALALESALTRIPAAERIDAQWALDAQRARARQDGAPALDGYAGDFSGATVSVEEGALSYRMGRRPAIALIWLTGDVFTAPDDPRFRYTFRRDGAGRVDAIEIDAENGERSLRTRDPAG
jgi:hypothetical protein